MTNQTEQGAAGFSLLPVDDMESWPQGGRWTTAIVLRLLEEYAIANMMADRHKRASNPPRPTPEGYTSQDPAVAAARAKLCVALGKNPQPISTDLRGDRYFQGPWSQAELTKEQDEFVTACTPEVVDDLLAENDLLRAKTTLPPGYALVPLEPTDAMVAARNALVLSAPSDDPPTFIEVYRVMVAAATAKDKP